MKAVAPQSLELTGKQLGEIIGHITGCAPEEACGLLAGRAGQTKAVFLIPNELHSPVRFRMSPEHQLAAFLQMEAQEMDLMGIFHSHPGGPPHPSATDLAESYYPEAAYLILSPRGEAWQGYAFSILNGAYREISLIIRG